MTLDTKFNEDEIVMGRETFTWLSVEENGAVKHCDAYSCLCMDMNEDGRHD
jgi:hypothetical protein